MHLHFVMHCVLACHVLTDLYYVAMTVCSVIFCTVQFLHIYYFTTIYECIALYILQFCSPLAQNATSTFYCAPVIFWVVPWYQNPPPHTHFIKKTSLILIFI